MTHWHMISFNLTFTNSNTETRQSPFQFCIKKSNQKSIYLNIQIWFYKGFQKEMTYKLFKYI